MEQETSLAKWGCHLGFLLAYDSATLVGFGSPGNQSVCLSALFGVRPPSGTRDQLFSLNIETTFLPLGACHYGAPSLKKEWVCNSLELNLKQTVNPPFHFGVGPLFVAQHHILN
jgi:hypothetical protein